MSLRLPLADHPARKLFEISDLAKLADISERAKLPTLIQAKIAARNLFNDGAVRSVHMLVLRADARLYLMRFGPRGGVETLWNFGEF